MSDFCGAGGNLYRSRFFVRSNQKKHPASPDAECLTVKPILKHNDEKKFFRLQKYYNFLTYANNLAKNLQICEKCCIFAAKFRIMETIELKKKLTEITSKADKLTTSDREFVKQTCKNLGIKFEPQKEGCKSCYQDAALACLDALKDKQQTAEQDGRAYVLRKGVDVFFGSIRVNEHTLTDELAERIIARGFDTKFFARCK